MQTFAANGNNDLRKFFSPTNIVKGINTIKENIFKDPIKINSAGTKLLNPKTKPPQSKLKKPPTPAIMPPKPTTSSIAKAFPPTSYPGLSLDPFNASPSSQPTRKPVFTSAGGNLRNVKGFRDLNATEGGGGNSGRAISGLPNANRSSMSGRGFSLSSSGSSSAAATPKSSNNSDNVDRNLLRDVWSKRFSPDAGNDANKEASGKSLLEVIYYKYRSLIRPLKDESIR